MIPKRRFNISRLKTLANATIAILSQTLGWKRGKQKRMRVLLSTFPTKNHLGELSTTESVKNPASHSIQSNVLFLYLHIPLKPFLTALNSILFSLPLLTVVLTIQYVIQNLSYLQKKTFQTEKSSLKITDLTIIESIIITWPYLHKQQQIPHNIHQVNPDKGVKSG